eukprot:CAMPEP_0185794418 /NCGR_PEP_ID=MMETSP1174-20130828/160006_1 /TAXON_ID=35687 /ORGANISM="Dictyocha speculum, Strain CCMP1381" /LENGTH=48 /DNA_ID= /DNA_START= /DNA_END= /DNA_ORIENTATION=
MPVADPSHCAVIVIHGARAGEAVAAVEVMKAVRAVVLRVQVIFAACAV